MNKEPETLTALIAPPPQIDKYPIIIGSNISLTYISSASRLALSGFRAQFVDVLDELLDHEPHGYSVLSKRVLSTAGGRLDVSPVSQEPLAIEIADCVRAQLEAIPHRTQSFAQLLWGLYYGISAQEIVWERDASGWRVRQLQLIHPRRLSYPDSRTWDLYVWDQGSAMSNWFTPSGHGAIAGIRIESEPHKFVVFAPSLRGNYQTREGLGRILSTYFAFKRLVLRVGAQDFERFVRPWAIATYRTSDDQAPDRPRTAGDEDVLAADRAIKALGAGSLSGVTLPDSIKIELLKATSTLSFEDFLAYLDAAISKAVLGQTFTTQSGKFGSRSTADVGKRETLELTRYDAAGLSDALRDSVARSIVSLNYPGFEALTPRLKIHVDEAPDPAAILELARVGASLDMPIDAIKIAEQVGLPLVQNDTDLRLRLVKPYAPDEGHSVQLPTDGLEEA